MTAGVMVIMETTHCGKNVTSRMSALLSAAGAAAVRCVRYSVNRFPLTKDCGDHRLSGNWRACFSSFAQFELRSGQFCERTGQFSNPGEELPPGLRDNLRGAIWRCD